MRVSIHFALPVAAALFGLLLIPRAALAQAKVADCPTEPTQSVPIASGDVYAGANCTLYSPGDVDSFVFSANAGDTYQLTLGYQGGATPVCLTLYDPNSAIIIPQTCTSSGIANEKPLITTGTYTILVTEPEGGGQAQDSYALSLERINPLPPDAQPIGLSQVVVGTIAAPTEQNVFTFYGATTGTYEVTITYTGGPVPACIYLYYPGTTTPSTSSGCTSTSYSIQFKPSQDGTYMLLINGAGNDATVSYNLEIACVLPTCKQVPYCKLADALSYASGTLTMNFTIDNSYATTWNIWLTDQNTMKLLYSKPQPITDSPMAVPMTTPLTPEGTVGVLSTLTTPAKGITCSSWVQIETGAP
jgi:hypothetical protein